MPKVTPTRGPCYANTRTLSYYPERGDGVRGALRTRRKHAAELRGLSRSPPMPCHLGADAKDAEAVASVPPDLRLAALCIPRGRFVARLLDGRLGPGLPAHQHDA